MNIKKHILLTLYVILILCLVGWLTFSNQIILHFDDHRTAQKVSLDDYYEASDIVKYNIDYYLSNGDLVESILIQGWAYVETDFSNEHCRTEMLLVGKTGCYSLPFGTKDDGDLYASANLRTDIRGSHPDERIASDYVGFKGDFSTFMIPDGVYDIYIYRWENEYNSGIVRTPNQLVKAGSAVSIRKWQGTQTKVNGTFIESSAVRGRLDSATISDNDIVFSGWSYEEGIDSATQQVYLNIQSDDVNIYYSTLPVLRTDVAVFYENDLYQMSGFSTGVSLKDFPSDESVVTLMLENNGKLYQVKSYLLKINDGVATFEEASKASTRINALPNQIVQDVILHGDLNSAEFINNNLKLRGWICAEGLNSNEQSVYIQLLNQNSEVYYTTVKAERPDVADYLQDDRYILSGYVSDIPFENCEDGEWDIIVWLETEKERYSVKRYSLVMHDGSVAISK